MRDSVSLLIRELSSPI